MVVKASSRVTMYAQLGNVYSPSTSITYKKAYQDKRSIEFNTQLPCLQKVKGKYMLTGSNRTKLKAELVECGCDEFMFSMIARTVSRTYQGATGATRFWAG